jgi:tagaturonate reductase
MTMNPLKRKEIIPIQDKAIKVVQFGAGNFLRGFVDWIFDIMNEKGCFDGHIQIIQSVSSSKANPLNDQEGLYHVMTRGLERGETIEQVRLITCVRGAINAQEDVQRFLEISSYESLQFLISNTTEAGIVFEEEPFEEGRMPKTFPGKLTLLLHERFRKRCTPLVILPCELIEDNGDTLREKVLQYARHWNLEPAFAKWVVNDNIFCNTLVDRIVPGGSDTITEEVGRKTGYFDPTAIMAEPYYFWAIDAPLAVQEMLPAEKCGLNIKYTGNLSYYRERKVRILNGAHTALMPVAYLAGLRTVKACFSDEKMRAFISSVIFDEIVPTLDGDRSDLNTFAGEVIERFTNPFIEHKLLSISLNSTAKFRVRILPTILRFHQVNHSLPEGLMRSFAALIIFYRGHWKQEEIELKDQSDVLAFFKTAWRQTDILLVARLVLENTQLWGSNLNEIPGMHVALSSALQSILSEE